MNNILATNSDGEVFGWEAFNGKLLYKFKEPDNEIYCCDYHPSGLQFATGGKDRTIRIYDDVTQDLIRELSGKTDEHHGHANRIFALKYSPDDPNILLSGGWDNLVLIWDTRKESPISHILGPNISGEAIDIFGDRILAGSFNNNNNLSIMSMSKSKVEHIIDWYDSPEYKKAGITPPCIYAARYTKPNAEYIVAGGTSRNEVRVFRNNEDYSKIKGIGTFANLSSACITIDCAHESNKFVIGCANGTIRGFRIEDKEEL